MDLNSNSNAKTTSDSVLKSNFYSKEIDDYIENNKNIQLSLLKFIDDDENVEENYDNLVHLLADQKIQENYSELKILFNMITRIANYHHRSSNFYDKIIKIILIFKYSIKNMFSNTEIFQIFQSNKRLLLFLLEENLLKLNNSISQKLASYDDYFYYFYPELSSYNFVIPRESSKSTDSKIIEYIQSSPEEFDFKRRIGENDDYLCKLIREDDIDNFITYINKNSISVNSQIEDSIYETNAYLTKRKSTKYSLHKQKKDQFHTEKMYDKSVNLIKYASFFGSIQIFKYLYLNGCHFDILQNSSIGDVMICAIHGCNEEIIHILEQSHSKYSKYTLFTHSIKFFQYEAANYFYEKDWDSTSKSIKYFNFDYFPSKKVLNIDLCKNGYLTLVEILFKNMSIDKTLIFKDNLLIEVLKNGHFDIFKFIMENKPDKIKPKVDIIDDKPKYMWKNRLEHQNKSKFDIINDINKILYIAVQNENVKAVKFLLENPDIDINSYFDKDDENETEDKVNVSTNVDENETEDEDISKLNDEFTEYKTALHISVETGNTEIISLLLNHPNIKVNSKTVEKKIGNREDGYGDLIYTIVSYTRIMKSALHIAIQNNDCESVELLIDHPFIDVNSISRHEYRYYYEYQRERIIGYTSNSVNASELKTCLFSAIENLNIKIIQLLLSKSKIDVNHPSCIITNRDELINYLDILASDDVLDEVDFYENTDIEPEIIEQTPLSLSFEKENDDVISLLLSNPTIDVHQDNALSKVIKNGNVDIYNKLLSQTGYEEKEFKSALHNAVESGNIDMVKTILNRPEIDVNGVLNGKTAIQIAASKGNLEIFNHLLHHPNFDIMHNYYGQKALNEAAEKGNLDIFKALLEKPEIDINYRSKTGFTVLHHAVRGLNIDIVNLLLERPDMNINVMSNDNITAFQIAADLQNVEIIRAFLKRNDAKFDPNTIYPNINENQVKIVTFSLINSIKAENQGNQEIWDKLDEKFLFYIFNNSKISSTSTLNFFLNQLYQFQILNKII